MDLHRPTRHRHAEEPRFSRRTLLAGGGVLVVLAAGSGAVAAFAQSGSQRARVGPSGPPPPPAPSTSAPSISAAPTPPPYLGPPVRVMDLHPASAVATQTLVQLPDTGELFTTQAAPGTSDLRDAFTWIVGDLVISRLASDGSLLDSMTLPDAGHGMGLVVRMEAGQRVLYSCWYSPDASGRLYDIVRIPYAPGTAKRADASAVVAGLGYPIDPSYDASTDTITLRHQGGAGPQYTRHRWVDFVAGNLSRPTGVIATPDTPPVQQGFCSLGDRFFFLTGAPTDQPGGDPATVTEFSWTTGEVVGAPQDATGLTRLPDGGYPGGYMEPEGAAIVLDGDGSPSLLVGIVTGGVAGSVRTFPTFRYPLTAG